MSQHLMIDFETLGVTPDCVVLSLGACLFDAKQGVINDLYLRFDINEQLKLSRVCDGGTIEWWMTQNKNAQQVFRDKNTESIKKLPAFLNRMLMNAQKDKLKVWCKGLDFDIAIMNNIYRSLEEQQPWKFWNVICFRTFLYMTGIKVDRKEISHNALDDARDQAQIVINYFRARKRKRG